MWLFASTWSAILILLIGMLFEGSWIQPMRYISHKNKIPNLLVLYLDMKLMHWILVVIFAITLGNVGPDKPNIFHSIRHASPERVVCAVLGGAAISLGDVLIYYADALCGTALAFPIAVGLLSAVGTIFVYIVEPKGNPIFLFCGVGLALISVIFGGLATWLKEKEQAKREKELATARTGYELSNALTIEEDAPKKESMVRGVILAIIAGFIYSAWSPLGTLAARGKGCPDSYTGLSPHAVWLLFVSGMFVSNIPFTFYSLKRPLSASVPSQSPLKTWLSLSWTEHAWAASAGVMTLFIYGSDFLAGPTVGFAIAFGIINSNPVICALWGIFLWHEFDSASKRVKALYGVLIVGFILSIALIVLASYVEPTHPLLRTCSRK